MKFGLFLFAPPENMLIASMLGVGKDDEGVLFHQHIEMDAFIVEGETEKEIVDQALTSIKRQIRGITLLQAQVKELYDEEDDDDEAQEKVGSVHDGQEAPDPGPAVHPFSGDGSCK